MDERRLDAFDIMEPAVRPSSTLSTNVEVNYPDEAEAYPFSHLTSALDNLIYLVRLPMQIPSPISTGLCTLIDTPSCERPKRSASVKLIANH